MGLSIIDTDYPPLELADAKAHLRVDFDIDDDLILGLIDSATDYFERETRQALRTTECVLALDGFPAISEIRLPLIPLTRVGSIEYIDAAGNSQTFDSVNYTVDITSRPGRIAINHARSWPATSGIANSVRVTFDAGYDDPSNVPQSLIQGIKLLVGHWYENREGAIDRRIDTVPIAVESIISQHAFPQAA